MWPTIIIVLLLGLYVFYVVRKRVREIKAGKLCSCSCADCANHCSCAREEKTSHQVS